MSRAPIGVFDSGVGGLSVLREIRNALPAEDLVYVADSGFAPYGERPADYIHERAGRIVAFLQDLGAKAVVVACNTATTVAVQALRTRFALPIVAIEPAVKPAAATTRSGVVGILATSQTLASPGFTSLMERFGRNVEVVLQPCPGLVERIERGELEHRDTRALLGKYVAAVLERGADTIVLGCTHFPFVHAAIAEIAGSGVALIDPAAAVARELRRRLEAQALLAAGGPPGSERFWTSGDPQAVAPVVERLWGRRVPIDPLPRVA